MKSGKSHHHTHSSSKGKKDKFFFTGLEQFLLNWGLGIAGAILLILGLLFLLFNHFGSDTVFNLIQSFLKPGPEEILNPVQKDFPLSVIFSLSFLYIPGFIPLIVIFFLPSGKVLLKNILITVGFFWLIFADGKVFLYNSYHEGIVFPDFNSAFIFFAIILIILIVISVLKKSRFALNLSVIFFFVYVTLIRLDVGALFPFFILLMFLLLSILFLSLKFRWRSPFVSAILLSACFITFFILRKIIIADNPQPVFYMFSTLFVWSVISASGLAILKSGSYRKRISALWDSISYISPFLVIASGAWVIRLFGMHYFFLTLTTSVFIILFIVAILNERYHYLRSRRSFYFSICIFGASLIPQLLFSNFLLIFAASLSVTLLIHFHLTNSKTSLVLSKILFVVMLCLYLVEWGFSIIHSLSIQRTTGDIYPFALVLVCLLVTSISFFYIRLTSFVTGEHRSLQNQKIIQANIALKLFPFIAYTSCFMILDYLLINLFKGYRVNFIELAMFSYAFLWLAFYLNPSGSRTTMIVRTVLSYLAIALYPVIVHPEVIQFRNLFIEGNSQALIPFILHFICIGLIILFLLQTNGFLVKLFPRLTEIRHYIKLVNVILVTFFLLAEYNNLSLLWFNHPDTLTSSEILRSNEIIPYSIILLFISISFLIYSLIRYSRFLRRVSLTMIILVIFKILFFDLKILAGGSIVLLLITVGLILLGLAIVIRRIRKQRNTGSGRKPSEVINIQ